MSEYRFLIKKIDHPTADTVVIELCRPLQFDKPQSGLVFDYKPGQYLMISYRDKTGKMTDRHAFSIASSPTSRDHLKLGIRIGGTFTRGLAELGVGEEIFVSGPFGKFVFNEKKHRDLVLIAGGIGITPFLSAMEYATAKKLPNKLSLLYSNKSFEGTLFYDEIKKLAKLNKNIRAEFFVTDKTDWQIPGVLNKRITSGAMDDFIGPVRGKNFFICGPEAFMAGMKRNLEILGVEKHQIEMEEFSMLQKFQLARAIKSSAYALSLSGALILVPLYLFLNSSDASAKGGYGSIFSSSSPYSIQNIYRVSQAEYTKLSESVQKAIATRQNTQNITTPVPERVTEVHTNPADKPKTASKKVTPVKIITVTKQTRVKTATKATSKPVASIVPEPKTEVSPTILAEQAAKQNQVQTTPSPVTSASAPATNPSNQQTTQTPAPSPVTSASTPAGTTGSSSGSTSGSVSAATPSPVTSASAPASSGGSTVTSGSTGTATLSPTPRHHEDDDD